MIENGKIQPEVLKRELITRTELEIAAHKQGFASLDEIERAVIEPGGTIAFFARKPAPEVERYQDIIGRLDQISGELAELRRSMSRT